MGLLFLQLLLALEKQNMLHSSTVTGLALLVFSAITESSDLFVIPRVFQTVLDLLKMGRTCSTNEKRNAYKIFVGKPKGKRKLGRPRCRWVGNIKMNLREIGSGNMDWIDLAQDMEQCRALVNTVMNLRVPLNVRKF
jgi:hypothetical protein